MRLADGRLQVGPVSAGADPGPACYRRGGPATLTDCNVVLGRIPPARFPAVFGTNGDQPIDPDAARERLSAIAAEAAQHGTPFDVESLAEAFVQVGVARMANAVRELTLHHGEDAAQFALVSFGGAAGQHACAVAEALDIREILLHPLAGVLSAYGIALAGRRVVRRGTAEIALDAAGHARAEHALGELAGQATRELARQGVSGEAIDTPLVAHLRLAGSDTTLDLPWQGLAGLRAAFVAAHERLYGFTQDDPAIVISALTAEAVERVARQAPPIAEPATATSNPAQSTAVWLDGGWRRVPLLARADLRAGQQVAGPLLLAEDGATSWIAPGWAGEVTPARLPRAAPRRPTRRRRRTRCSPRPTRCGSRYSTGCTCTSPSRWVPCCARPPAR